MSSKKVGAGSRTQDLSKPAAGHVRVSVVHPCANSISHDVPISVFTAFPEASDNQLIEVSGNITSGVNVPSVSECDGLPAAFGVPASDGACLIVRDSGCVSHHAEIKEQIGHSVPVLSQSVCVQEETKLHDAAAPEAAASAVSAQGVRCAALSSHVSKCRLDASGERPSQPGDASDCVQAMLSEVQQFSAGGIACAASGDEAVGRAIDACLGPEILRLSQVSHAVRNVTMSSSAL